MENKFDQELKEGEWISVTDSLPNKSEKVKWLMENGQEDFGWYNGTDFCNPKPTYVDTVITHWKNNDNKTKL